jgi:hypothetical protein
MEAFLSHWRALRAAATGRGADENEHLAAMDRILGELDPADRAALEFADAPASGVDVQVVHALERRRQRSMAKLRLFLAAAGWLH